MDLVQQIIERAKSNKQRIVLPEATEERTLKAADMVLAEGVADLILIGNPDEIHALAEKWELKNIDKATLIDPENNPKSEEYAALLTELRKSKGMTIEKARELVKNPLYLGCMIIKTEGADGQISGALSTTGDTLRPALQIIKCSPGITCVSGAMLLITKKPEYGENGVLVVGDVAVPSLSKILAYNLFLASEMALVLLQRSSLISLLPISILMSMHMWYSCSLTLQEPYRFVLKSGNISFMHSLISCQSFLFSGFCCAILLFIMSLAVEAISLFLCFCLISISVCALLLARTSSSTFSFNFSFNM